MKKNIVNVLILVGVFLVCLTISLALIFTRDTAVKDTPIKNSRALPSTPFPF